MTGSLGADGDRAHDAVRVLFVCTANRGRSVLAEALAERRFEGSPFVFASAGLLTGGGPMPPNGVRVAAEAGFDMTDHRSERVDIGRMAEWDLVLTMTREHARELVAAEPGLWPRTFTILQFARWLDEHPPGRHADVRGWVELVAADRPRTEMIGSRPEDEIADPVNGPPAEWRELLRVLTDALEVIAGHLLPPAQPTTVGSDAHPARHPVAEPASVEELGTTTAGLRIHRERALDGPPQLRAIGGSE